MYSTPHPCCEWDRLQLFFWDSKGPWSRDWPLPPCAPQIISPCLLSPYTLPGPSCMHRMRAFAQGSWGGCCNSVLRHNQDSSSRFQRQKVLIQIYLFWKVHINFEKKKKIYVCNLAYKAWAGDLHLSGSPGCHILPPVHKCVALMLMSTNFAIKIAFFHFIS